MYPRSHYRGRSDPIADSFVFLVIDYIDDTTRYRSPMCRVGVSGCRAVCWHTHHQETHRCHAECHR